MHVVLEIDGEAHELWLARAGDRVTVEADDATFEARLTRAGQVFQVRLDGAAHTVEVLGPDRARLDGREVAFKVAAFQPGGAPGKHTLDEGGAARVKPPMPGRIVALRVREGDRVAKGQVLLVLEAMKMQNEVAAPVAGVVKKVHVREGQTVEGATLLLEIGA